MDTTFTSFNLPNNLIDLRQVKDPLSEWKKSWNNARSFQELHGLLYCGLEGQLCNAEQIVFYLTVAQWQGISHAVPQDQRRLVNELAQMSWKMLCLRVFKINGGFRGYSKSPWVSVLQDNRVGAALLSLLYDEHQPNLLSGRNGWCFSSEMQSKPYHKEFENFIAGWAALMLERKIFPSGKVGGCDGMPVRNMDKQYLGREYLRLFTAILVELNHFDELERSEAAPIGAVIRALEDMATGRHISTAATHGGGKIPSLVQVFGQGEDFRQRRIAKIALNLKLKRYLISREARTERVRREAGKRRQAADRLLQEAERLERA